MQDPTLELHDKNTVIATNDNWKINDPKQLVGTNSKLPHLPPVVDSETYAAFKKLSGTSWRGIVREGLTMRKEQNLKWSQLALAANTPMLLRAGLVEGRLDAGVLSSGQVTGVIDDLPTVAELISRIMGEAEQTLKRLGDLS